MSWATCASSRLRNVPSVLMLHDHDLIDGLALEVHIANVQRDRLPRRRLAHTDILARSLPQVPCPVHTIYGAHDAIYRQYIHQLEDAFAAAAPAFRGMQLIEGAGHWVQQEQAEAVNRLLLDFLARRRGGTATGSA